MIYLASPYSHPDPAIRQARHDAVARFAGAMIKRGMVVYSPIAHTHAIAQVCDLPGTWEFWKRQDEAMLDLASGLVVLCLDGWQESVGVQAEIAYANCRGIEVHLCEP